MPDSTDSQRLNPQVRSVEIGKRTLRNIPIYPLSLGDQLDLTDLITKGINAFMQTNPDESDESMVQFISIILGLIKENIEEIIEMITGEGKEILKEITNQQLSEVVEIVYTENYEGPLGKLTSLFQEKGPMTTPLSPSPKRSPRVVRPTATN
jgi:hypothetical protein